MAAQLANLPRCANCGVEIPWRPAVHRGKTYCCGGCVQGGPCYCSYDLATPDPARPASARWAAAARSGPGGRETGVQFRKAEIPH